MKELTGKDTGAVGNANEMYYNVPKSTQLKPTVANIKANTVAVYQKGTSEAGQRYGHVIYIEGVIGDTVLYTEGGSNYYMHNVDGVLKKASKSDILNGSSKFGSGLIGFIDVNKL